MISTTKRNITLSTRAAGSAPFLATQIKKYVGEDNVPANTIAHALLGAVVAHVQGNDALAGAAGAAVGELIARQIYPTIDRKNLSEEQKQTISALSTLAGGLAAGIVSDSGAGAVAGGQAGKNAVENNLLGGGTEDGQVKAVQEHAKNILSCSTNPGGAACQKGLAMQDALTVALPAGLGGGVLIAATPEIAALLKAGVESCIGALAICINNLGLQASEVIVPGGVGAGGAIGVGKTVAEAAAAKTVASSLASQNANRLINGKWFDAEGLPLPVPPSAGAAGRVPNVLQSGGNTLNKSTANALNESLGENMTSREWGRALEALKKDSGLRNDFHGRILDNGDYVDKAGKVIGNIGDYVP